jgi:hypothetical protein
MKNLRPRLPILAALGLLMSMTMLRPVPALAETAWQAPWSVKAGLGANNPTYTSSLYASSTDTAYACVTASPTDIDGVTDWYYQLIVYIKNAPTKNKYSAVYTSPHFRPPSGKPQVKCSPNSVDGPPPVKFEVKITADRSSDLGDVYLSGLYDIYVNYTCARCGIEDGITSVRTSRFR